MSDIDMTTYKDLYFSTAYEYLSALDTNLPKLTGIVPDRQLMDSVLIAAHSLKSQSYVMKYMGVGQLCALIEKRLLALKEHPQPPLDAAMVKSLADCAVKVRGYVDGLKAGQTSDAAEDITRFEHELGVTAPSLS